MSINPPKIDYTFIAGFLRGIKPDPILTVSEWADLYRELPQVSAEPGKFRMSRTPYNKEISDRLSVNDPAQIIIFKKASQIGATETANNWLGYIIDAAPAPMLYVMPTDMMMKDTSKNRIQKMIDSTTRITSKIKPNKSKDSGNTIQYKEFEGGFCKMVGANSPVGLASTAVRYVYLDEVDRYPLDVGGEGSAIKLASARTSTFGSRRKIFITSTPTLESTSTIDALFKTTGQRRYYVPCPHCASMQVLEFEQLRWEKGKYENVQYECAHCRQLIDERHKTKMLADGQWIAELPELEDGISYGYHISALYSPVGWYGWSRMAKECDEAQESIPDTITFTNTIIGEVYKQKSAVPDYKRLYERRENYSQNHVFPTVTFITCGVDVQADRIELEIVGWIKGKISQSIDYRIITGDTTKTETWDKLEFLLSEMFKKEDGGILPISAMCIDTGYNTQSVYDFCLKHLGTGRVIPVKGNDRITGYYQAPKAIQITRAGQKLNTIKVYGVGVNHIKSELYGWLRLEKNTDGSYPPGYCHFPEYDEHFFRGITAERLQLSENKKGFMEYTWHKHYKRNEALDCRVYARVAAAIFGMDFFQDHHWSKINIPFPLANKPGGEKQKKQNKRDSIW